MTGIAVDEVERGGRHETFRLHLRQTWVRGVDGWVVLAGHASAQVP